MKKPHEVTDLLRQLSDAHDISFDTEVENAIREGFEKAHSNRSAIAIKVLTILGGVLATLLFIGFLYVIDIFNSTWGMLSLGIGFIVGSIVLSRRVDLLILDTIAVTLYASGLLMFGMGLSAGGMHSDMVSLFIIIMALITLVLIENYMLAFVAAIAVSACSLQLAFDLRGAFWISLYLSLAVAGLTAWIKQEAVLITANPKLAILHSPIRLALVCTVLLSASFLPVGYHAPYWYVALFPSLLSIGAILYLLPSILPSIGVQPKDEYVAYVAVTLVLVPILFAPAIACVLLVMILCFSIKDRTGFVMGIIGLIYYIGVFYYNLDLSLLVKSLLLMGSGILLIVLYFLLHQYFQRHEKI
ncbi:DUF4401 domain-containing protein [Paraflavitalea sp. CAU 1676]|uniref:DUF4401 domain-containing protein n=1 Tax=Paraflavitalea sp. CAU 1676 TaxID=3032598 RepID=UPI0023D9DB68|nr:DUF4401 domain-containing protein [Paraflavitalea sp. CAU 1676]MDF2188629.1 DUF4401 domain-containing protein [Paraflavitalea sp. CAU 1676]